jgi:hypothetical protein
MATRTTVDVLMLLTLALATVGEAVFGFPGIVGGFAIGFGLMELVIGHGLTGIRRGALAGLTVSFGLGTLLLI